MTNDQIKKIALACGFNLKEQPTGEMDLNPYVYDFARELIKQHQQSTWTSADDMLPPEDEPVLAWDGSEFVITYTTEITDENGDFGFALDNEYATHWQDLPEPPKTSK